MIGAGTPRLRLRGGLSGVDEVGGLLGVQFKGGAVEDGVAFGEAEVVTVVAAADDAGDGDVFACAGFEDDLIASGDASISETEMAQSIIVVDIDAGVVEDEVGLDLFEQVGEADEVL